MKRVVSIWLLAILILPAAPFSAESEPPARMKPALLVIDVQNAYLPGMSEEDKKEGLEMINVYIRMFRLFGHPVIRVYHVEPGVGPERGTEAFEFPPTILVKPDDPLVVKNYGNAFKKTDLDTILKQKGVNTVFLCGLSSIGCVLATYHGAMDLDYQTFMLKSALIGPRSDLTRAVQEICDTIDYPALLLLLQQVAAK